LQLATEVLPKIEAEGVGPFDMIFIDADQPPYAEYLAWALRLARPGSVIVADNVIRNGEVLDPESTDDRVAGVRRFNTLLAAEDRVSAIVVQTVGSKGRDGMAIAVVR
jgi:caffeoyl-CoA O-methyltransferase